MVVLDDMFIDLCISMDFDVMEIYGCNYYFYFFSFGIVIVIIVGVWVSYCLHETIWLIERFVGLVMHAWYLDEERVW